MLAACSSLMPEFGRRIIRFMYFFHSCALNLAFTLRAPMAGVLTSGNSGAWPQLGQMLDANAEVGAIEPRFTPAEQVDLTTRLIDARRTVEELTASLTAARASYEQKKELNAKNRLVADRTLEEAEAKMEGLAARLEGARETVRMIESARESSSQAARATPLRTRQAGEVVELATAPGEAVESGQTIMRVARFDDLLARVELPPGESAPVRGVAARVAVLGNEGQELKADWVGWAGTADPKTRNRALLLRVENSAAALRPGLAITAHLPISGEPVAGVIVPLSAVVRYGDRAWVYVAEDDDKFVRREIHPGQRTGAGWFTDKNFQPGDRIVVAGAQVLVAEEMRAQGAGGSEE